MGFFNRSSKVAQQGGEDVLAPASTVTTIRDRMVKVAKNDRPPTKREKKKIRKVEKKELEKKKEARSGRIQELLAMRQANSAVHTS